MIEVYGFALSESQVAVLTRGLRDVPTPKKFWLDDNDDGAFTMRWDIPGFAVTAVITRDGTLTVLVDTKGRIEDFPLVAALMKFTAMLYAVFAEDVYTGDKCVPPTTPPRTLPPSSSA